MQKIHRNFPFKFNGLDDDLFTEFNRKDFSKKLQSFGDDLPLKKFNDKSFENWKESGNRKIRKIFDGIIEEGIIKSRVRRRTDECFHLFIRDTFAKVSDYTAETACKFMFEGRQVPSRRRLYRSIGARRVIESSPAVTRK